MKEKVVSYLLIAIICACAIFQACRKTDRVRQLNYLKLQVPAGWPNPVVNIFKDNPPTEEGFQLGRKLFYDGRLSADGAFPCSSCHQRNAGFGTYDHDRSHGYNHSHTLRNAPGLFNLAWMVEFNWDGEYLDIPARAHAHIVHPTEMGTTMPEVISKLEQDPVYVNMFSKAFGIKWPGEKLITQERITKALAQFTSMFISANSKYDRVKSGLESFTSFEETGYNIFKSRCASCHTEPLFTDHSFRNTGLGIDSVLNDKGRMAVTHNPADSLKFRVPTLRNTSFTFPYMHDGRIISLEKVVDHYSTGVRNSSTTDTALLNKPPFTAVEKVRLVQFLQTLNDSSFLTNPRYDKP